MVDALLIRHAEALFWLARYVEPRREPGTHPRRQRNLRARPPRRPELAAGAAAERRRGALRRDPCRADAGSGARLLRHRPGQPELDRQRRRHGAGECARAAVGDLDRDVGAAQRVPQMAAGAGHAVARARPPDPALRADPRGLPDPYRHHRRHAAPRPGILFLPARPLHRTRRPDHAAARHQVPRAAAERGRGGIADRHRAVGRAAAVGHGAPRLPAGGAGRRHAVRRRRLPAAGALFPAVRRLLRAGGRPAAGHPPHPLQPRRRAEAAAQLGSLNAALRATSIATVVGQGLHEFLDGVQRQLIDATTDLAAAFFEPPPRIPPAQVQAQG